MANLDRVLLVDDSRADRECVRRAFRYLNKMGNLAMAENGEEAMQCLDESGPESLPNIILMDINMPVMDGKEALSKIRENCRYCHIPVIFLTTSDSVDEIKSSYCRGANAYLVKPASVSGYIGMLSQVQQFWFDLASLPN